MSQAFHDGARELNIGHHLTPAQAPWSHGEVERAIKKFKFTYYALQAQHANLDPEIVLWLAAGGANSQELRGGFSMGIWERQCI